MKYTVMYEKGNGTTNFVETDDYAWVQRIVEWAKKWGRDFVLESR